MKETTENLPPSEGGKFITRKESGKNSPEEEYLFESAGIRERPGRVPLWLVFVAIGLLVWGIYYLAQYWHPS